MNFSRCHQASSSGGFVSFSQIVASRGWSRTRFDECVKVLLHEGLAMMDEQHYEGSGDGAPKKETLYWFPCLHGASHCIGDEEGEKVVR